MTDRTFIDRLENWGRWCRQGAGGGHSCMTGLICHQMAVHAGAIPARPQTHDVDEDDARVIEWCWARCGYRLTVNRRALLRAYFVAKHDQRAICKGLHIPRYRFQNDLNKTVAEFGRFVSEQESPQRFHHGQQLQYVES